jgi:hypothetical protein
LELWGNLWLLDFPQKAETLLTILCSKQVEIAQMFEGTRAFKQVQGCIDNIAQVPDRTDKRLKEGDLFVDYSAGIEDQSKMMDILQLEHRV